MHLTSARALSLLIYGGQNECVGKIDLYLEKRKEKAPKNVPKQF